jgi:hypothetical protein
MARIHGSCADDVMIEEFNKLVDDITALRTAFTTLTAKIDADSGDTGGDNDYADGDPAALTVVKLRRTSGVPGQTVDDPS